VLGKTRLTLTDGMLWSTQQLAEFLQIKPRTIETWRRLGTHPELVHVRVGRRIRYRHEDVRRFLADGAKKRVRK
jgi:hypothetical protein